MDKRRANQLLVRGCGSTEENEIFIYFLCQCPSLGRRINKLFDSPILVSITELHSFIDVKYIVASLIKLLD